MGVVVFVSIGVFFDVCWECSGESFVIGKFVDELCYFGWVFVFVFEWVVIGVEYGCGDFFIFIDFGFDVGFQVWFEKCDIVFSFCNCVGYYGFDSFLCECLFEGCFVIFSFGGLFVGLFFGVFQFVF